MSDIEKIKQLRKSTGAGFKDCSSALEEGKGDIDKAIEILRIKGISKASKKMLREAKEGVIAASGDGQKTSIIEVNCETDFVAKNNNFINFVKELSELNNQCNSNVEKLIHLLDSTKSVLLKEIFSPIFEIIKIKLSFTLLLFFIFEINISFILP